MRSSLFTHFISLALFLLVACGDDDVEPMTDVGEDVAEDVAEIDAPEDSDEPDLPAGPTCEGTEVVTFATSDDVVLEADLHHAAVEGPIALLFHMIPPSNDRSNYGAEFIDALTGRGINVLNVDRRGAGGSGGVAAEAYEGAGGALDVAAAAMFARAHPCAFDVNRLFLVGASNGTTSTFDYVVATSEDETLPRPAAVVWLTPGGYTETQHSVRDKGAVLSMPLLFVWTEEESAADDFIAPLQDGAPRNWTFQEYTPGDHGTLMFTASETAVEGVVAWLDAG